MYYRLLFGLIFACFCATASVQAQESLLDVVLKRDKLIVATYSTSPPLAYVDDSGKLVGFEIDMAREIAKDLLGDPKRSSSSSCNRTGAFRPRSAARSISACARRQSTPTGRCASPLPAPISTPAAA
jgi:ABC-type amino acid transport substrate-binding protein